VANRLVYSPHDYAISVFHQDWFDDPTFPANLPGIWDSFWGYIYKENIAPIMVGEFGSTLQDPKDRTWLTELMRYMGTGVNGMSFTYWSWNPNSGDTGGILNDDWTTVNQTKQSILQPYLIPPVGGGPTGGPSSGGPSGGPSSSPSSNPTVQCTVAYTVDNAWSDGFQASVQITNSGTNAANNWQSTWTVPSGVSLTNGWNATVTQSGTTFTATAPSWAPSLAPGASVTVGFTATGPSTPAASGFTLNGAACN
jgi:endoglucanase